MCAVLLREHLGNKLYFSPLQAPQVSRHLSGVKNAAALDFLSCFLDDFYFNCHKFHCWLFFNNYCRLLLLNRIVFAAVDFQFVISL